MVGYGGTHSIELLRKPGAEYVHDENYHFTCFIDLTLKRYDLWFTEWNCWQSWLCWLCEEELTTLKLVARDGLQKTILFSTKAAEATRWSRYVCKTHQRYCTDEDESNAKNIFWSHLGLPSHPMGDIWLKCWLPHVKWILDPSEAYSHRRCS